MIGSSAVTIGTAAGGGEAVVDIETVMTTWLEYGAACETARVVLAYAG